MWKKYKIAKKTLPFAQPKMTRFQEFSEEYAMFQLTVPPDHPPDLKSNCDELISTPPLYHWDQMTTPSFFQFGWSIHQP